MSLLLIGLLGWLFLLPMAGYIVEDLDDGR